MLCVGTLLLPHKGRCEIFRATRGQHLNLALTPTSGDTCRQLELCQDQHSIDAGPGGFVQPHSPSPGPGWSRVTGSAARWHQRPREMPTHETGLKHTQYAIYLVITFSAACVLIDSAQVGWGCAFPWGGVSPSTPRHAAGVPHGAGRPSPQQPSRLNIECMAAIAPHDPPMLSSSPCADPLAPHWSHRVWWRGST